MILHLKTSNKIQIYCKMILVRTPFDPKFYSSFKISSAYRLRKYDCYDLCPVKFFSKISLASPSFIEYLIKIIVLYS